MNGTSRGETCSGSFSVIPHRVFMGERWKLINLVSKLALTVNAFTRGGEGRENAEMEAMAAEDEAANRHLLTDKHPASSLLLQKRRGACPEHLVALGNSSSFHVRN